MGRERVLLFTHEAFGIATAIPRGAMRLLGLSVLMTSVVGCGPVLLGYKAVFTPIVCAFPGPHCEQYMNELKRDYADMERPFAARRQLAAEDYVGARQTLGAWAPTDSRLSKLKAALEKQADLIEARSKLAAGARALGSSPSEARENFQSALEKKVLSTEETVQARDGLCLALYRLGESNTAYTACRDAATAPGSTSVEVLRDVSARRIEAALNSKELPGARAALADYARVHGVSSQDVASWETKIAQAQLALDEETRTQYERQIADARAASNYEKMQALVKAYSDLPAARRDLIPQWERETADLIERDITAALRSKEGSRAAILLTAYRNQAGSSPATSARLDPQVARLLEQAVSTALNASDPRRAQALLTAYKGLRSAKPEVVARLERDIHPLLARVEAEEKRRHQDEFLRSVPRLIQKHGAALGLSEQQFIRHIMATTTVLGARFFTGAEIEGETLRLWLAQPGSGSISLSNLSFLGDIADRFIVWCRCPGTTIVGYDLSHLGGGRAEAFRYTFNAALGQARLR